jgi:hypothetical protein
MSFFVFLSSPIWDPDFKQTAAPHLGSAKAAALAAAVAASGSSDSDSLSSRYLITSMTTFLHSFDDL